MTKICKYSQNDSWLEAGSFCCTQILLNCRQTEPFDESWGDDGEFGNPAALKCSSGSKKTIWRLNLRKAIIQNVCMGQMIRVTAHSGIKCDRLSALVAGLPSFSAVINSTH